MSHPPTGTVTFLFTDIQGSTALWEQHPDAMRPALARHDGLLRRAIETHGGFVFKTVGDAFCAAFPTAPEALEAALAAQLALAAEPWGLPTPLAVRMGLHTGTCEERGGDYFGQPINRVARLMAAGYGGQTLLSLATQELCRSALPLSAALSSLGEHRLKDLGRPEHIFQLLHPALPENFPPLNSLSNPALPNNLPLQTTSFIGRERETGEVKALLAKTRLLTLTASGGAGKTRLSLQVAADLLTGDGDGVWLAELAPLADPDLVPQAIARVLGVAEQAGQTIQWTLVQALKDKRLLLILDNCEHLIRACAVLAADILRNCPQVHLLASSREPLGVAGEQVYRVPSLSLPDPRKSEPVETLSQYEAVRLFIERAQAVQPSFAVTDSNAYAVSEVCRQLDGIPLALELAVARVRVLSVEQIMARLDDRFRLLTGGSRAALPRQQTLRALIDWSYNLLTEGEKTSLRRLSVFAGGWTLEAAEHVCAGDDVEDWEVLDQMTGLVDKSLVVAEPVGDETRFRLLETVRQYARDRLGEAGEADAVGGRAAAWFLTLAERAEPELIGPEQESWLSRLETEHDNLRAALAWYERQPGGAPSVLRLAAALWRFWFVHGHLSEGRRWLARALAGTQAGTEAGTDDGAAVVRGKALNGAGTLAWRQGDFAEARDLYGQALAIRRRQGDQRGISGLLSNLGNVAHDQGDLAGARALHDEALTLFRPLGDQWGIATLLANLGNVAHDQGELAEARDLHGESLAIRRRLGEQRGIGRSLDHLGNIARGLGDLAGARALHDEALTLFRRLGDQRGIADALDHLGNVARGLGDLAQARDLHGESLAIQRRLGNQRVIGTSLINLGTVAHDQGDLAGARALHDEALTLFRRLGDQQGIAECLDGMVATACSQRRPGRAARLGGASAVLRESIDSPPELTNREKIAGRAAEAKDTLGEAAFAAAWDEGRAMTPDQAVEYALADEE